MEITSLPFCNYHPWNEQLYSLITRKVIPLDIYQVKAAYELHQEFYHFTGEYENLYHSHDKFRYDITPELLKHFSYYTSTGKLEYVGIDLPVYLNHAETSKKIMFVAVDPLRSGKYDGDRISLGTVFGVHDMEVRRKALYWKVIQKLSENNTVYLTDTFKLFFYDRGKGAGAKGRSYNIKQFTNPEQFGFDDVHQDIFREEVNMVKPDLIVTIGKHPYLWFTGLKKPGYKYDQLLNISMDKSHDEHKHLNYDGIPVLPLAHLSGAARSVYKSAYGVSRNEEIIEKYVEMIAAAAS